MADYIGRGTAILKEHAALKSLGIVKKAKLALHHPDIDVAHRTALIVVAL